MDHNVLWLQATPSIALLYYHLHLKHSHVFYCLDEEQHPTIRSIARSLHQKIVTTGKKKVAVYCLSPCPEKKYQGIVNFLLKSQENLKIKSVSLPTSAFQWHMLNAWSNTLKEEDVKGKREEADTTKETNNSLYKQWKDYCNMPLEPAAFALLPEGKTINEFMTPFTVADQQFTKKALFVHMTPELYDFSLEKGFRLKDFVLHAIQGWKRATTGWTLFWILDENDIFGKKVNCLDDYRKKLHSSIEAYAFDLPIYTFTVNYDATPSGHLSNHIAWIQHRHHICLKESILLKWAETPLSPPLYFENLECIYLNMEARVDEPKWRDNFLSLLKHQKKGQDSLDYIRSTTLGLPVDISSFITPLLSSTNINHTEEEQILTSWSHRLSYNPKTVNDWIESMEQYKPKLKWPIKLYEIATTELLDAEHDEQSIINLQDHVRATYKTRPTGEGEEDEDKMEIHSKVEDHQIVIFGTEGEDGIFKMTTGKCTCGKESCCHVLATLLVFIDMPAIFGILSDTQTTVGSGVSSVQSQKRESDLDRDDDGTKRLKNSQEGFIPILDATQLIDYSSSSGSSSSLMGRTDGYNDGETQLYKSTQEPSLTQEGGGSFEGSVASSNKSDSLAFSTISSVGSIRYKESLSNPLMYSPNKVYLDTVIPEKDIKRLLANTTERLGESNLSWQASTK